MSKNSIPDPSEWPQIGDEILARIEFGMSGGSCLPPARGRVVYVHPKGRFYTLEFRYEKGSIRQSYPIRGRLPGMPGDEETYNGHYGNTSRWLESNTRRIK